MTFRNDFYFIDAVDRTENGVSYTLRFNADHVIYQAHFPGEPITPGVCILQVGVELLSDAVGCEIELFHVKNVKFLNVLHPDGEPVYAEVRKIIQSEGQVSAQIDFRKVDTPVAKMSLICRMTVK